MDFDDLKELGKILALTVGIFLIPVSVFVPIGIYDAKVSAETYNRLTGSDMTTKEAFWTNPKFEVRTDALVNGGE